MKKSLDYISLDDDGNFDLESFMNSIFERIKALVIVIADGNSETTTDENLALIDVLKEEVLEIDQHLRRLIEEEPKSFKTA